MPVDLSDVTLCAVDCVTPELAGRALEKSMCGCRFGRVLLLTDKPAALSASYERIQIEPLQSIQAYSAFMLKQLNAYIQTEFVLVIQWDGHIVDAQAWRDEFRQFDYIGARWDWFKDHHQVGNGGFSWRSKKLLEAVASPDFRMHPDLAEDLQIGRLHREPLERKAGIRFADAATADCFSYERSIPERPTFGFHGLFNMWRHASDAEVRWTIERLHPRSYASREFVELMITYWVQRKFPMVRTLMAHALSGATRHELIQHIERLTRRPDVARAMLDLLPDQGLASRES